MTTDAAGLSLRRDSQSVAFWIHVTPRARRAGVGGLRGDALRVAVQAPAAEGRANEACAVVLADALGVRRADVELDPGSRSRRKRVWVVGDPEALVGRLQRLAVPARLD